MKEKDVQEIENQWILFNIKNNNKQNLLLRQLKNYIYNEIMKTTRFLLTNKY
jgi:hypothetical protein